MWHIKDQEGNIGRAMKISPKLQKSLHDRSRKIQYDSSTCPENCCNSVFRITRFFSTINPRLLKSPHILKCSTVIEHSLYDCTQLCRDPVVTGPIDANERSLPRVCTRRNLRSPRLHEFQSPACVWQTVASSSFLIMSQALAAP